MASIHIFNKRINEDFISVQVHSDDVTKMATEVLKSFNNQKGKGGWSMGILGHIEAVARVKGREKALEYTSYNSPKYIKPISKFYADLIKDEILEITF